jgi:hypothetical protein
MTLKMEIAVFSEISVNHSIGKHPRIETKSANLLSQ